MLQKNMRITNPQNSNGDKLLSVKDVVNRYKRVSKTISIAGEDLGTVKVTSADIDGENLSDYVVVCTTIDSKTSGITNFSPEITFADDELTLRYFSVLGAFPDLNSYATVITLENIKSGVNVNIDATTLTSEQATRRTEDAKILAELRDISKSVLYGDSTIEVVPCDNRQCTLKFGETKTRNFEGENGGYSVEYVNDGHYYKLTCGADQYGDPYNDFEATIDFVKYSGEDRVCTFYVIIDLREVGGNPIVQFTENIHWLGTGGLAPVIQANSYNVLGFCQIGSDVIVGNMVFSF